MPSFHLTPAALLSLKSIASYTETTWGTKQRNLYLKKLDKAFHTLASSPKKGRTRNEITKGLYSYPEGKHVIFYIIKGKSFVIVDILHERMEPRKLLSL